jgi:hypothetical protein
MFKDVGVALCIDCDSLPIVILTEVRPYYPKIWDSTTHSDLQTVQRPLMGSRGFFMDQ